MLSVEQTQEFVNQPSRWPHRPMLPMKMYLSEGVATGYLLEQQGLRIFDYDSRAPVAEYATVADLVEAGWQID